MSSTSQLEARIAALEKKTSDIINGTKGTAANNTAVGNKAGKNQSMGSPTYHGGFTTGGVLAPDTTTHGSGNATQTSTTNSNTGGASAGTSHTHNLGAHSHGLNNHSHSCSGAISDTYTAALVNALNQLSDDLNKIFSKMNAMS